MVEFEGWVNVGWVWHVPWRRRLFEWEKPLESRFLQELQGMRPDMEIVDSWEWKDGECLRYSVKSTYVVLRRGQEGSNKFLLDNFWKCKALPSTQVTAWRVLTNKIATMANLERHGIVVESLCVVCAG